MGLITWGQNPWGLEVPVHIAWWLLWVSLLAGLAFMAAHAVWILCRAKTETLPGAAPQEAASRIPKNVPRHSLPARVFHWVMAAAVLTLLFSAFLPKVGPHFAWVTIHWTFSRPASLSWSAPWISSPFSGRTPTTPAMKSRSPARLAAW